MSVGRPTFFSGVVAPPFVAQNYVIFYSPKCQALFKTFCILSGFPKIGETPFWQKISLILGRSSVNCKGALKRGMGYGETPYPFGRRYVCPILDRPLLRAYPNNVDCFRNLLRRRTHLWGRRFAIYCKRLLGHPLMTLPVAACGNEVVRWERVDGYLRDLGVPTCGHDDSQLVGKDGLPEFIPENIFSRERPLIGGLFFQR